MLIDFNDFDTFEYGKTYEIYVTKTGGLSSFTVSGESTGADLNFTLKPGENFISPPVTSATAVTTVLSDLTYLTDYDDVRYYDASTSTWKKYSLSDFTNFEKGKGYIIDGSTGVDETFTHGVNEVKATYTYDSSGARVKKVEDGTTTVYLGKDYDKTGTDETKYIFLGDSRIATSTFDGTDYTAEYVHSDHISSSNVITDDSGVRIGYHEYDPYGTTVVVNPETGDNADPKHKFTGQEEDADVGLYNYNARMYDPQLGRFITPDWIIPNSQNPQDFNRYSYVRNNPIKYIDPTGNFGFVAALIVGAIIAGGIASAIANKDSAKTFGDHLLNFGKGAAITAASIAAGAAAAYVATAAVAAVATSLGATAGTLLGGTLNVISIVGSGAAGGYVGNGTANVLTGQKFNKNGGKAAILGGILSAAIGAKSIVNGFKTPVGVNARATLQEQGLAEKSNFRNVEDPNITFADDIADGILDSDIQNPMVRGRLAEERVLKDMGLAKNNVKVSGREGNSIPDAISGKATFEIKDTKVVSYSKQLRIQVDAAIRANKTPTLVTGCKTNCSGNVKANMEIITRKDLGPQ